MDDFPFKDTNITGLACDIVDTYATRKTVSVSDLTSRIAATHARLAKLCAGIAPLERKFIPIVPIEGTVTPDHIISLEDGKPYKALKRHLASHGLTPDQYRRKWDLPPDYPMVAVNYAARCSSYAKRIGLGRIRRKPTIAQEANIKTQIQLRALKCRYKH
ncbi:MucR family transcriptional regulator [Methylobacterium sp. 174MFSha1.1]|uniref:MucR family transcriptional regulator n=1 Tax=Methylobacterium sp. 174MFSha1.1 TaxID=1502749 RepID=UPI000B0D09C6|nr:MucR family transcriptional regulator [Methylobacterium sp. 174MFSha1.1]